MVKRILLIVGVLALICCIGGAVVLWQGGQAAINMVKPILDTSEGFMTALKSGDYDKAYTFLDPELQTKLGGVDAFKETLSSQGLESPTSWKFENFNSSTNNGVTMIVQSGTVSYGTTTKTISLTIVPVGDGYKIAGYAIN